MLFGYVRVSSKDQNPERQIEALKNYSKEPNVKFKCNKLQT
jgi:DNA invertase Pin-like site-specific DNA recombinase